MTWNHCDRFRIPRRDDWCCKPVGVAYLERPTRVDMQCVVHGVAWHVTRCSTSTRVHGTESDRARASHDKVSTCMAIHTSTRARKQGQRTT
eukprot:15438749-Alexandrium_andersonii.AAC.1